MHCLRLEVEDTLLCKGKETCASQDPGAEQSLGLYAAQSYNPEQVIGGGSLRERDQLTHPILNPLRLPIIPQAPPMSTPPFMDPCGKLTLAKAFMTYCFPLP